MFYVVYISPRVSIYNQERHANDLELNNNSYYFYIYMYKTKEKNITSLVKISGFDPTILCNLGFIEIRTFIDCGR